MAIDAAIPLAVKPPEPIDPLGQYAKLFQLRQMSQQAQAGALNLQEHQRALSDQDKLREIYRDSWTTNADGVVTPDRTKLLTSLAQRGLGDKIPEISESLDRADKSTADVIKARADADAATKNAIGSLMAGVRAAGYTPEAFQSAAAHVLQNKLAPPDQVQQYLTAAGNDPGRVKAITDKMIAESQKQTELDTAGKTADARVQASATGAARLTAELPKITAETLRATQETTGAVPMTPAQTAANRVAQARLDLEKKKNAREQATFDATIGTAAPGAGAAPDPVAQAIAEYRLAPPAARSLSTPGGQALMKRVSAINPDFDATQFPNRNKTRQSFTTGTQGQQINAMNTAIGHLDQLGSAIAGLDNGDVQVANQAKNWLKTQLGSPSTTNFDTLKVALSGELASVLKKSGATDAEIKSVESTIASKNSPAQLAGYVQTQIPILGSKLSALNYQYHQAMGDKDPFSALSPEAKGVLTKHGFDPANPTIGDQKPSGPDLSGLKAGHGRTFTDGPYKGQTWTLGPDGQPKQVKD